MTTVVVLADVPTDGSPSSDTGTSDTSASDTPTSNSPPVLEGLVPPLSSDEAAELYRAMLADVCETVQHGEADLLVNYPAPDDSTALDPEAALREFLDRELTEPDAVRYEPQVGSTRSARVGNAVTHLLDEEGVGTVGVVEPTAPFLRREHIGQAAMKLRSSAIVLGPAPEGRVTFAGFREPIDFSDVYAPPALETLTERAVTAGLDVDFLSMTPRVETPGDLVTADSLATARRRAERLVPPRTTARLEALDFESEADGRTSGPSDKD